MPNTVVLVKIHGIGNQKPDWSSWFDAGLSEKLAALPAAQQGRVVNESVYWADLSELPAATAGAPTPSAVTAPAGPNSMAYNLAYQRYAQYLLAPELGAAATPAELHLPDLTRVVANLKDVAVRAVDQANDVANYVSNNGVRLAIQSRLGDKLFEAQARYPGSRIILGSHSQGTIIALDVLRLLGAQLPQIAAWVTMGSPFGWYETIRWVVPEVDLPHGVKWLNLYDPNDRVGKELAPLVGRLVSTNQWTAPLPDDVNVNNTGAGLDAHDHWHNPAVLEQYVSLISGLLA